MKAPKMQTGTMLLYFTGSWCAPCTTYEPIVRKCAEEAGIPIARLLVNENTPVAKRYCITGIPALVLSRKGKPPKVVHGPKTAAWLERWLSDAVL